MPSSPRTPYRRRPSSNIDTTYTSSTPQINGYSPIKYSRSRKSSIQSVHTPTTPRPQSSLDQSFDFGFSNEHNGAAEAENGLGSLADELAEAWDEDDEADEGTSGIQRIRDEPICNGHLDGQETPEHDRPYQLEIGIALSPPLEQRPNGSSSPPKSVSRPRRPRKGSQCDGSNYGDDSDPENIFGISSSLECRISSIESLVRQSTESNNDKTEDVIIRVAKVLKDLGSQAGLESGVTRLTTAHTALATHLTHQTRLIQTLAHPLFSPLSVPPSTETIEVILPLLTSLLLALPKPHPQPIPSLHSLHTSTTDLISTISYLSDTLHMTRQISTLAARRLKAAKEVVDGIKREMQEREEGILWVERGSWEKRLAERECAKICGDVVGGFEEVCRSWREKLLSNGGGVEVGAG